MKQKFSRALVLLRGACLLLTSCSEDLPVGESSAPAEEYPGYNGVFTVTLDGTTFTFYVAGEKAYEIEAKTFNIAWPGITTNYVGASFKIN